ncbi:hypothetical protein BsWGS_28362 [Bradybaena similaris]
MPTGFYRYRAVSPLVLICTTEIFPAAAVVAVVSSIPLQSCSDEMMVLSKCLSDKDLSVSDFQNPQSSSSDLQTILKHCSKIPSYLKAIECVTSEFTRCPNPNVYVPSVEQMIDPTGTAFLKLNNRARKCNPVWPVNLPTQQHHP